MNAKLLIAFTLGVLSAISIDRAVTSPVQITYTGEMLRLDDFVPPEFSFVKDAPDLPLRGAASGNLSSPNIKTGGISLAETSGISRERFTPPQFPDDIGTPDRGPGAGNGHTAYSSDISVD